MEKVVTNIVVDNIYRLRESAENPQGKLDQFLNVDKSLISKIERRDECLNCKG